MQLKQLPFWAALAFLSMLQLVSAGSFLQVIVARDASPLGGDTLASRPLSMTPLPTYSAPHNKVLTSSAKGAKGATKGATSTALKATTTGTSSSSTNSKIIPIVVGSTVVNKSLVFTPAEVSAKPGDILQFQFSQINHTVTQSSFSAPCQPIQASDPTAAGIHSGFVPVTANAPTVMTFDVPINDTEPMFIYCAQGPHCQLGMVMAINA
jgi:plastocyanin